MTNIFLRFLIAMFFPFVGLMCLLSFGGTAALIWLLIDNDMWYLAIPASLLAIAGLHLLYVFYLVFTYKPPKDFWEMRFSREQLKSLYGLVEGVSDAWDLQPPDEIRLGAGTVAHVYETDKGKRILVIGGLAVAAFSRDVLAGIVAHELAHFTTGDTKLSKRVFKRRLTMEAFRYLCGRAPITYFNPLVWIGAVYYLAFCFADARLSRLQEYAADRYAVKHAGPESAAIALIYVHVTGHLRWASLQKMVEAAVRNEQVMVPIFAQQVEGARSCTIKEWNKALQRAVMEGTGAFDSHPCLVNRMRAIGVTPKDALKLALKQDSEPACMLIPGWDRIEKDLSERLMAPFRERRADMLDAYKVMKTIDRIHGSGGTSGF